MFKIIKKSLSLFSLLFIPILPMRQAAKVLLVKGKISHKAYFHSTTLVIPSVHIVPMPIEVNHDSSNQSSLAKSRTLSDTNAIASSDNASLIDAHGWSIDALGNYKTTMNNFLTNDDHRGITFNSKRFDPDSIKETVRHAIVKNLKEQFFHVVAHCASSIHQTAKKLLDYCHSLSYRDVLTQKESLTKQISGLEAMHKALRQQNPKVCNILDAKTHSLNDSADQQIRKTWSHIDYVQALTALQIEAVIETKKLALHECDAIIEKIGQGATQFAQDIKNVSVDAIEKDVIPSITSKQEDTKTNIVQKEHILEHQNAELKSINVQLEPFDKGSVLARMWGFFDTNHSEQSLRDKKSALEISMKNNTDQLYYLYDQKRMYDAQIESAHQVSKHQHQETLWHELGLSSDAHSLINIADAKFTQFEQLRAEEQKDIIDLLNHGAQEKKAINTQACDIVIIQTVKIADLACQAYNKGNSKLGSDLIACGNTFVDCAVAYAKGAIEGIGNNIQHKLDHPMQALGQLAIGVVAMAALPLAPVTSTVILGASVAMAVVDVTHKLANLPLVQACQKAGEMSGDFAADYVTLNKAINATSAVAKVVITEAVEIMHIAKQELAAMGKFTKAEIDAWIKSEKLVASSVEGLEITVNAKKADLAKGAASTHLEMNALGKAKNGVKSEAASGGSNASRAGGEAVKITTKEATVMAEKLGFTKTNYESSGEAVFKKGNRYITLDKKSHNGGIWKMADSVKNLGSKPTRMGTYDKDLKWIGE